MKKPIKVNVVPCVSFRIGAQSYDPPPNPQASRGRSEAYVINLQASVAATLCNNGTARPAFDSDAQALVQFGHTGSAYWRGPEPRPAKAAEPAPELEQKKVEPEPKAEDAKADTKGDAPAEKKSTRKRKPARNAEG